MPTDQDQIGDSAGELTESEKRIAEERTALRAAVIHEAIRTEGEAELLRPASALMWSGMAAGLSMGFSLAAMGLLYSRLPDTQWRPLIYRFRLYGWFPCGNSWPSASLHRKYPDCHASAAYKSS